MTIDLDALAAEVAESLFGHQISTAGIVAVGPESMKIYCRALLARLDAEGWQLVPKEATEEMKDAVKYATVESCRLSANAYRAMLQAAPKVGK